MDKFESIYLTGKIEIYALRHEMKDDSFEEEMHQLIVVKGKANTRYFELIYLKGEAYSVGTVSEIVEKEEKKRILKKKAKRLVTTKGSFRMKTTAVDHTTTIISENESFSLNLTSQMPLQAHYQIQHAPPSKIRQVFKKFLNV